MREQTIRRWPGATILSFCDEDLEQIGIDPATVSEEQFKSIVDELQEYFNEGFQHALMECANSVLKD